MSRHDYVVFGAPITLPGGRRIEALYPNPENTDRRWLVIVAEADDTVLEQEYAALGNNPYGPDVDDVLRLEEVTKRLVEHYDDD